MYSDKKMFIKVEKNESDKDGIYMQSSLNRYILLAKRWLWIIVLGVVVCGGMTYIASKITRPTYQASTQLVLAISASQSPYENASAALELLPTYARLVSNPQVVNL